MNCPHHRSSNTVFLKRTTNLGYPLHRCWDCGKIFNERTGTPFNFIEVPTDILFEVLLCRCRYKMSYRDVAEYFLVRGFQFTRETVRDWEESFAHLFADELRNKRKNKPGKIWHVDETYLRVKGKWCYLYLGIDAEGNLVDVWLSETRDLEAGKAFFSRAKELTTDPPEKVVTDGLDSYPIAIGEELGEEVNHERVPCKKNPIEQSHRGIKQRYYPMRDFGSFASAQRFGRLFDEVKNFFRPRWLMGELVPLFDISNNL
jgi:putative transposase